MLFSRLPCFCQAGTCETWSKILPGSEQQKCTQTSPMVWRQRLHTPNAGGQGLTPGQGTRSQMLQPSPKQINAEKNTCNSWTDWFQVSTKISVQGKSYELSFIGGKMRTMAWETGSQIALRDCAKGQYVRFWWRGSSTQSSTYFTKHFLLLLRSWCHHEGI